MDSTLAYIFCWLITILLIYLAYRRDTELQRGIFKAKYRNLRKSFRAVSGKNTELEKRIYALEHAKKEAGATSPAVSVNPFEKMEARHAKEQKEIVAVNGVPVKKG